MQSGTVSSFNVFLEINAKERISCKLKRHLSPITVGLITRALPIHGNAHQIGHSIIYFETKINSGIERKRSDFKKLYKYLDFTRIDFRKFYTLDR